MDTPERAETPQDFVYKTKIVVLNYLGFGPPSFDLPPSPDSLSGSESESLGSLGSLASESGEDTLEYDGNSPTPTKEAYLDVKRHSDDRLTIPEVSKLRSKSLSPRPSKKISVKSPSTKSVKNAQPLPKVMIDHAMRKKGSLKRRSTFEMHEQYQAALRELLRTVEDGEVSEPSPRRSNSTENWHIQYQKAMRELIESVQKDGQLGDSGQINPLCPISREAIVAERIAQIGDRIMETHGKELEQALRTVMESNDGKLSYALFKAVLKETIKSHVPGWYHLAVTLNFTRHLAVGLLWTGSRGIESVSDFATRYIEENLAETILDQGGWDAITCINLDDLDGDSLSSISSGAVSPYTPDIASAGGPSIQPSPPFLGQEVTQGAIPTLTLTGSRKCVSTGTSQPGVLPGKDLTLKLEKLSQNQEDEIQNGQNENSKGDNIDRDEADIGTETDGAVRDGTDGGISRPEDSENQPTLLGGNQELVDYGKMALASAALAGLTAGMYALMRK